MKTNSNNKVLIRGKEWSYYCEGDGIPCLVIGISPLYHCIAASSLTQKLKFIHITAYWEKEHPNFDVSALMMQDLVNDIEEIRKQLGYSKIAVFAHSAIGLIALEYALQFPQNNLFNILIGTTPYWGSDFIAYRDRVFQEEASEERREILQQNLARFEQQKPFLAPDEIYAAEYAAKAPVIWFDPYYDCMHLWKKSNANGAMLDHYFNNILIQYNKTEDYKNLQVPVFLALGEYDYAVPYSLWDFAKNIQKISYNLFQRSGHYPMPEEQALFDEKVLVWLEQNSDFT
jgi:proline iminopeptidase